MWRNFQNSIKKNLSGGEISEFYKECPKVRMWRKNDKYQVCSKVAFTECRSIGQSEAMEIEISTDLHSKAFIQ